MRDREGVVNVAAVVPDGAEFPKRTCRKPVLHIVPRQPENTALHSLAHPQQFSLRYDRAEPDVFVSRGGDGEHLEKFSG